jgi:hypothetical protein
MLNLYKITKKDLTMKTEEIITLNKLFNITKNIIEFQKRLSKYDLETYDYIYSISVKVFISDIIDIIHKRLNSIQSKSYKKMI